MLEEIKETYEQEIKIRDEMLEKKDLELETFEN